LQVTNEPPTMETGETPTPTPVRMGVHDKITPLTQPQQK